MTIELSGFATVAQGFEVLVGQALTMNAQMMPSTVQESVTVTGSAFDSNDSSTLAGKHRSAADRGPSGNRRQLAGASAAGARQSVERC